jgi:hypothetical protein
MVYRMIGYKAQLLHCNYLWSAHAGSAFYTGNRLQAVAAAFGNLQRYLSSGEAVDDDSNTSFV